MNQNLCRHFCWWKNTQDYFCFQMFYFNIQKAFPEHNYVSTLMRLRNRLGWRCSSVGRASAQHERSPGLISNNIKPGMVLTIITTHRRQGQEDQKVKVILTFILNLKPAWAIWVSITKEKERKKNQIQLQVTALHLFHRKRMLWVQTRIKPGVLRRPVSCCVVAMERVTAPLCLEIRQSTANACHRHSI